MAEKIKTTSKGHSVVKKGVNSKHSERNDDLGEILNQNCQGNLLLTNVKHEIWAEHVHKSCQGL